MPIAPDQWTQERSARFESALDEWNAQGYHAAGDFLAWFRLRPTLDEKRIAAGGWLDNLSHETITDGITGKEDANRVALKRLVSDWRQVEAV